MLNEMQILLTGTSNSGGSLFLWTSCCGCTILGINHISMIHFLKPSVLHWYCTQASLIRLESAKKNYWSFGTNSLRTYILYRWTSTNSTLMTRRCKKKERMELAVLPQVWNRFSKTLPQIYKYGACRIGLGLNRFSKTNAQFWQCCIALSDTLVFLLNEYFIELNTTKFIILNKFFNWILIKKLKMIIFLNWIL